MAVVFPMKLGFKTGLLSGGAGAAASKIAFSDGQQKCKGVATARQASGIERRLGVAGEAAAIMDIALGVVAARSGISGRGRRYRVQGQRGPGRCHRQGCRGRQDEGDFRGPGEGVRHSRGADCGGWRRRQAKGPAAGPDRAHAGEPVDRGGAHRSWTLHRQAHDQFPPRQGSRDAGQGRRRLYREAGTADRRAAGVVDGCRRDRMGRKSLAPRLAGSQGGKRGRPDHDSARRSQ